jgi:hypothetical protein
MSILKMLLTKMDQDIVNEQAKDDVAFRQPKKLSKMLHTKMVQAIANEQAEDDITINQIQGNFWLGAYGELRLPMMKDCGFVNATKLCTDAGKRYDKWARLQSSTELMNTLKEMLGAGMESVNSSGGEDVSEAGPKVCVENGSNTLEITDAQMWASVIKHIKTGQKSEEGKLISGTYVHPDLLPSIAGWISPRHQIMTNRLRMAFDAWQYNKLLNESEEQRQTAETMLEIKQFALEDALAQRRAIEEELKDKTILVDIVQQGAEEMRAQKQFLEGATKEMTEDVNMLVDTVEQREGLLDKHVETIDKDKLIINTYSSDHAFEMYNILDDDETPTNLHYHISGQHGYFDEAVPKLKLKHPKIKRIFRKDHVANGINLRGRLKHAGIGYSNGNYFASKISQPQLIAKLCELYNVVEPEQAVCVRPTPPVENIFASIL